MKIKIISDLHQEFGISDLDFSNADLIILAGDTNLGTKGIEWVKRNIPDKPVIYLLGNHEYYKGSYPKTLNKILEASKNSNVNVLENNMVEFEGIRFHGATMWTDFSLYGNPVESGIICQAKMNDYVQIRREKGNYKKYSDIDLVILGISNLMDLQKIENQLSELNLPYIIDLSNYNTIKNPDLLDHIKRIGIVVYDKDPLH